ncbi:hypothetical protein GmHk_09G025878 [Glycine max]|nr:hypothetical protein GmHk_09G025878 [Glycine max]
MDEEQWRYDTIMYEKVDMSVENEEDVGVKVEHVDCSDTFNTSQHSYAGRLTKDEKIVVTDMTKSMVKPINILLTLKEHNPSSYTTTKHIYNAINAYHSSIRESNSEMQQLLMLLDRDQYIHWHRLKDENVVLPTKQIGTQLSLLDIIGVTPTRMTFSAAFAYLEGERFNNVVWVLQRFHGLFMKGDALPGVIVTDKDLDLINAVKTVFPDAMNLLCRFHIDKNVKTKCKTLVGLCETKVTIIEEMETISKRFEQLDVCGKVHLKTKLWEIVYPDLNSMCPPSKKGEDQKGSKKAIDQTTKFNKT